MFEEPVDIAAGDGTDDQAPLEDGSIADDAVVDDGSFVDDGFDGLFVYEVSPENGFTELGRISTRFDDAGYYWSAFTRGVFIGNNVFAATNFGVRGAPLDDVGSVPYELVLAPPIVFDETEPVKEDAPSPLSGSAEADGGSASSPQ